MNIINVWKSDLSWHKKSGNNKDCVDRLSGFEKHVRKIVDEITKAICKYCRFTNILIRRCTVTLVIEEHPSGGRHSDTDDFVHSR